MKHIIFCCCGVFVVLNGFAQGIKFINEKNWESLLKRAKTENKYLFVDCFATWCNPCRKMEAKVFTDEGVASVVGENFLSARVQMDSTLSDASEVKQWYSDAKKIARLYQVRSYPTFLFISPEGKLVHKGTGAKSPADFIQLVNNAARKSTQFYTVVNGLKPDSRISDSSVLYLLKTARALKDSSSRRKIARYYINSIERSSKKIEPANAQVLREVYDFIASADKKIFTFIYRDTLLADSFMQQKGVSKLMVKDVISREGINTYIVENNDYYRPRVQEPDWKELADRIDRKYGNGYSEELILQAQQNWYKKAMVNWNKLAVADIAYAKSIMNSPSLIAMNTINNQLWEDVFMHIEDKGLLKEAADIMLQIVKQDAMKHAGFIDTYANLLYKSGDVEGAKLWQSKAVEKNPHDKGNVSNYEKMKAGIPTWPAK